MISNVSIESTILNEFACYYGVDELPNRKDSNYLEKEIPEMALMSADRFKTFTPDDKINGLIATLHCLRDDKSHPLVSKIEDQTLMSWTDSPEIWQAFQRLLELIIINLK
jgi:hypothetical protein